MRNQTFLSRQLEYFSVLYRLKSYSAAAKAIPITYQGLKKSIGKLEAELGVVLFEPSTGDEIKPTHSAGALYDLTTKWMNDVSDLEREMLASDDHGVRTLNICSALGIVGTLGLSLLFQFEALRPNVRVSVTEYTDVLADESLLRGEYGIGLTCSPFDDNLVTMPLASFDYSAWINKEHPLAAKERITLADLEGENLMIPNSQYKESTFVLQALNTKGVHLKSKRFSNDPSWSLFFAEQGYGIGFTPTRDPYQSDLTNASRKSPSAVLVPITDGYTRTVGISHRRGHLLTADEKAFWQYCRETCKLDCDAE